MVSLRFGRNGSASPRPTVPRKPWEAPTCHEECFVQWYDSLLDWALRLSRGDRLEADDLLHEAFLQFVLRRRDLSEIDNLEAYLHGLLRRLRLSQARKALRRRQEPLLAVDYDTAEMCLPGADARELLQVREELRAVCEYACLRKDSSKAGSVLILRFFHGYYPKEIAAILNSPLRLANDWLRIARAEARAYLENPSRLSFLSRVDSTHTSRSASDNGKRGHAGNGNGSHGIADVLVPLRDRIRQARSGACLTPRDVDHLYNPTSEHAVSCPTLSHIVSCPECLELVTRHLDLASYSDRDPRDMLGPDGGWRSGNGAHGGNAQGALLRTAGRRLRTLREHRPIELSIAANGLPLGALTVGGVDNRVELAANLDEPIDFIEIFSEQNVRLLLLEVEPPPHGDVTQHERVILEEERWLDLTVEFNKPWPTVHLEYRDPSFAPTDPARLLDAAAIAGRRAEPVDSTGAAVDVRSRGVDPSDARVDVAAADAPGWRERLARVWRVPLLRPAFGIVAVAAAVALWAALPWHGRVASANELLRAARSSEQTLLAAPNVVVHRVLLLEERRPPDRTVVSRRRVELWQDGARGVAVRRLYDERDRLSAGEWTASDGSRTVYRPGAAPTVLRAATAKSIDFETVWEWDPTARWFAELVGTPESSTVQDRGGDYLLRYRPTAGLDPAPIVEATLTIRKAEMRAVAHTLVVRADEQLREYEFTETSLASVPSPTVPSGTFELEPELIGRAIPIVGPSAIGSVESSRLPASTAPVLSDEDENRLEVDALFALHRLEACLSEPPQLARAPNGSLQARAGAPDALCRSRVVERLAALGRPPALYVDVVLAAAPAASSAPVTVAVDELPPAYRTLADRFGAPAATTASGGEKATDAARAFGSWAQARASGALAEARELERLVSAWTPERLRTLDVDRITMWQDVMRDHARRVRRETEQLRRQLETVFAIDPSGDSTSSPESLRPDIHAGDEVPGAVARLVALAVTHETAVRQMFDVALESPRVPVDVAALVRSMRAGERQAAWFDEPLTIQP